MARSHQTSLLGISILAFFGLLFSVGFLSTAHAQSDQDPLQENYGTGKSGCTCKAADTREHSLTYLRQSSVLIWEPHTPASV